MNDMKHAALPIYPAPGQTPRINIQIDFMNIEAHVTAEKPHGCLLVSSEPRSAPGHVIKPALPRKRLTG